MEFVLLPSYYYTTKISCVNRTENGVLCVTIIIARLVIFRKHRKVYQSN